MPPACSEQWVDTCVPCSEWKHTHIYTHTLDLYIFSVANAHNLHFSVALHFALNLTRSISSANINSHFCCRPDAHTYRHAHTDCVSDLSLRHLLEVFVQILSLTLKWNVNVAPVKALCLQRCRFYPLQILNILPSVPSPPSNKTPQTPCRHPRLSVWMNNIPSSGFTWCPAGHPRPQTDVL